MQVADMIGAVGFNFFRLKCPQCVVKGSNQSTREVQMNGSFRANVDTESTVVRLNPTE